MKVGELYVIMHLLREAYHRSVAIRGLGKGLSVSSYRNVNILKSWRHKDTAGKRTGSEPLRLDLRPGFST